VVAQQKKNNYLMVMMGWRNIEPTGGQRDVKNSVKTGGGETDGVFILCNILKLFFER
jgi:hypothetical protein